MRILVTGGHGLVGQALIRQLKVLGYGADEILSPSSRVLNLTDWDRTWEYFLAYQPDVVFHAAAKVGGIMAHSRLGADFIRDNLRIQTNTMEAALGCGVSRFLFFGSACAYPKHAQVPIQENQLMCGPLEETNRAYAVAKIAGIKMCQAIREQHKRHFISCMPTNLYGIGDNYHPEHSHVLPGMVRKFHEAVKAKANDVILWGSGTPTREFLFADDLAEAAIKLLVAGKADDLTNIGSGEELILGTLAGLVAEATGFTGNIHWDKSKPDGTPRRLLNSHKIFELGWKPRTNIKDGIKLAYQDFLCRNEH